MKNDLVERLRSIDRSGVMHARHPKNPHPTCVEAADAIEALTLPTPTREEVAEASQALQSAWAVLCIILENRFVPDEHRPVVAQCADNAKRALQLIGKGG